MFFRKLKSEPDQTQIAFLGDTVFIKARVEGVKRLKKDGQIVYSVRSEGLLAMSHSQTWINYDTEHFVSQEQMFLESEDKPE